MPDLLADLYAEIDRRETNAKAAAAGAEFSAGGWRNLIESPYVGGLDHAARDFVVDNGPAHELAGLAEDRDILRRHAPPDAVPKHDPGPYSCVACSYPAGPLSRWVTWPCPDVLSLARRLGVEVPK